MPAERVPARGDRMRVSLGVGGATLEVSETTSDEQDVTKGNGTVHIARLPNIRPKMKPLDGTREGYGADDNGFDLARGL